MIHACQTISFTHGQSDVTEGFLRVKPSAESYNLP